MNAKQMEAGAEEIYGTLVHPDLPLNYSEAVEAAENAYAAFHPTIITRDQLGEVCNPGAVIIDNLGQAWQADEEGERWFAATKEHPEYDLPLPAKVMHYGGTP